MRGLGWTLLSGLTLVACARPGPRSQGEGEASWGGDPPWSGPCVYEVQTRWATPLPHIIRLTEGGGERSLVLQGRRRFPSGSTVLSPAGAGGIQGLVLEGATVRGAVLGTLVVTHRADSTFVDIAGTKAYRDTVPLEAGCQLGPV